MTRRIKKFFEYVEIKATLAAHSKYAAHILFIVSFLENFISPIPGDVVIAPLSALKPEKKWFFVVYATIASVLGSLVGYAIGFFLFKSIGEPLVSFYGGNEAFHLFKELFNQYGFLTLFLAALTPIPDKAFAILSGVTSVGIIPFVCAIGLGRCIRFGIVAYVSARYGREALILLGKKFKTITIITVILIILVITFFHFAVQ